MTENQTYTMLVVDDAEVNRLIISRILSARYNILMAADGQEALEVLRRKKVDVIITDIHMPRLDGFELIRAVRTDEQLAAIPIIVMTIESECSERKALELGADEFITKPFDSVVVEKRVDNITKRYILEREKMNELVREHEKNAARLKQQAELDGLTGALNRAGFRIRVKESIESSPESAALLMIDIDEFKTVNDKYGHPAGDELLTRLTARFKSLVRPEDIVGRIGGDEFAVFLASAGSMQVVMERANEFVRQAARIRKEIGFSENQAVSIGVAYAGRENCTLEKLYTIADRALYLAKENGKGRAVLLQRIDGDVGQALEMSPALFPTNTGAADSGFILGPAGQRVVNTPEGSQKKRILVVEDNKFSQDMLVCMFEDEFTVETADDGNEALIRLRQTDRPISIVLLDLLMPGIDGFEVLEEMRKNPKMQSIPVIVVSGSNEHETCLRAIKCGASEFITKPVDADLLQLRVHSCISRAENELLLAQNHFLSVQSNEVERFRAILASEEIVPVDIDLSAGRFVYDTSISLYVAGDFDGRALWDILTDDAVAKKQDIERLRALVDEFSASRTPTQDSIELMLRIPGGEEHLFRIKIIALFDDMGEDSHIVLTFRDIEA